MDHSVSVIVPLFNEEKYIKNLILSINQQDYPHELLEVVFVDGNSTDNTVQLIHENIKSDIQYKIINNTLKKTPISVNLGIKNSTGEVIVRLDGHSEYDCRYIRLCVQYLFKTNADNVGCLVEAQSEGMIATCIAEVLSSKFGVGNSRFRVNSESGYVDTVPFGCFKRDLFDRIGYFNEELLRSEDNEFNSRIIKNGGKIYLFNDIKTVYHSRDSIKSFLKMGYLNGYEIISTGINYPGSIGLRHIIPLLFVVSILASLVLIQFNFIKILFSLEMLLYFLLDLYFTVSTTIKSPYKVGALFKVVLYPAFHISYGIGSLCGLLGYIFKR